MRRALAPSLLTCCLLLAIPAHSADPNAVAVQVGNRSLSVSELERRWQELPSLQRRALGSTHESRVRTFVQRWVVPELLLLQATDTAAPKSPQALIAAQLVLQQALVSALQQQNQKQSPITEDDIRAYFGAHPELFARPERLRLFRILLADRKSAEELIQKVKDAPFDTWRNLAREKSLDAATRMRAGELGFVSADGRSDIAELQVDPKLFEAAARLKDGELLKEPIEEGDKFAVLWRRGHTAAQTAQIALHREAIREHLEQARTQAALAALVAELRQKHVREVHPELLETVTFEPSASDSFSVGKAKKDGGH